MAQPHAHSQPIETYGLAPHNRNVWPSAHNRICYVAMSARNTRLSFSLGLRTCLLDFAYVEACCSESTGGYVRCQAEGRRQVRWGRLFLQLPLWREFVAHPSFSN